MRKHADVVAGTMLLAAVAASSVRAEGPAGVATLSRGMGSVTHSIGAGDFAQASSSLGDLFDAGGGSFTEATPAVAAGQEGEAGYLGAYSGPMPKDIVVVPEPKSRGPRQDDSSTPWGLALFSSAAAGGLLLLARDEPLDPDHRRGGTRENPTNDPIIQKGIDEKRRETREREKLSDPVYREGYDKGMADGYERGKQAQKVIGGAERFLKEMGR